MLSYIPPLDPDFIPSYLMEQRFEENVSQCSETTVVTIGLEREDNLHYRFDCSLPGAYRWLADLLFVRDGVTHALWLH